jgi:hypothetical protein
MKFAALALTMIFVADDPRLPSLALEVAETASSRRLIVASVPAADAPTGLVRTDAHGRDVLPLGTWPIGPSGTSLVPAVDGVIVTIDDADAFVAAFRVPAPPPDTQKKKTAKAAPASPHPWPPPRLPVLGPGGLRVFLPAIVDGVPASASLHLPDGAAVPGVAVVWTHSVDEEGVVVARAGDRVADLESGTARLLATSSLESKTNGCRSEPAPLSLRETVGTVGPSLCIGGLEIRGFVGMRVADTQNGDRPARGVSLRRFAYASTTTSSPQPLAGAR